MQRERDYKREGERRSKRRKTDSQQVSQQASHHPLTLPDPAEVYSAEYSQADPGVEESVIEQGLSSQASESTMSVRNVILFNGVKLTDDAPGRVQRYRELKPLSWIGARVLLYTFMSFPRLWSGASPTATADAENNNYQYRWQNWVRALEAMPKHNGSWGILARYLCREVGSRYGHEDVHDLAKAVIELTMRDAEAERNTYRSRPQDLPAYMFESRGSHGSSSHSHPEHEGQLMSRIRSAGNYEPRVERIEKCIYEALAARDAHLVLRIRDRAPQNCPVQEVASTIGF